MKNSNKLFYLAFLGIVAACSFNSELSGNTTEIENAIAIRLFDGGAPAANVHYRVLPAWFVADTAETASAKYTYEGSTDTDGWVRIDGHKNGDYTISFTKGDSSIILHYTLNNLNHEYTIDSVSLEAMGAIKGLVDLPDSATYAWVALQGLDTIVKTDSLGQFHIQSLPSGNIMVSAWDAKEHSSIGHASVTVPANDTVDVGMLDNPNKVIPENAIRFMPSTLISDWMRPLSFPTVLIMRLDSTNFDFDKAAKDGSDIRLYDGSGELLPFEIDGWDTTLHSATLNIRVENATDTVRPWMLKWNEKSSPKLDNPDVWKDLDDSLVNAINSVEVLNFENGTIYNDLPEPLNQYDWYIQAQDSAKINEKLDEDRMNGIEKADRSIFGKNVLHVQYTADRNKGQYVVIGTRIAEHPHDLSRLDSVEVWLKGDGEYEIILETIIESDTNYKASYKQTATKDWKRVVVRPSDFAKNDGKSYHGWEATRNRITRFTIFAFNGSDLWVDNIKLYGINYDDLW